MTLGNVLIAAATAFVGFASYAWYKFNTPIAPGLPIAGSGSLVSRLKAPEEYGKDPVEFLCRMRKKLGDVFYVDLLLVKFVFCLGPEYNKLILRAAEEDFSFWKQIEWASGPKIGKTITDEEWLPPSMKIAKSSLMNQDRINLFVVECTTLANEHFDKWSKSDSVPLFQSVSYLVLSFMVTMLMGEDFYRKYGDEIIPKMDQFERDLQNPILRLLPWSLWGLSAPGRRHLQVADRFGELARAELDDILKNPERHAGRTDYFYNAVEKMGNGFRAHYGTHIMSMIFAGHANVALTVPWMYLHARRHPGAWQRICDEAVLQPSEPKPYLEACFRETGRLYTNALLLRMTQRTINIGGFDIPAGTLVACSPLATQRVDASESSSGIFKDSRRWLPDRFLPDTAFSEWFNKAEFLQFGLGPHQCPGEKLAKTMVFEVILRTWAENYNIDVVSGLEEGVKGVDGVGAEAAWTEENFGTPSVRGRDVMIRCRRRV